MMEVKIKKQKAQKEWVMKWKRKFENSIKCLEAAQLENKINYPGKHKIDPENVKENHKKNSKNQQINIKNTAKI